MLSLSVLFLMEQGCGGAWRSGKSSVTLRTEEMVPVTMLMIIHSYIYIYIYIYIYVHLLFIHLFIYLFMYLFICLFICLCSYSIIYLFIYLFNCLFMCLLNYLLLFIIFFKLLKLRWIYSAKRQSYG